MMDRDSITRAEARTPGVKRQGPLERWCPSAPRPSTQIGDTTLQAASCRKGGVQTARREELAVDGKAPSDIPAFQPDGGKPAVRKCVQERLECSVGDRPTEAKVRSLVAWLRLETMEYGMAVSSARAVQRLSSAVLRASPESRYGAIGLITLDGEATRKAECSKWARSV